MGARGLSRGVTRDEGDGGGGGDSLSLFSRHPRGEEWTFCEHTLKPMQISLFALETLVYETTYVGPSLDQRQPCPCPCLVVAVVLAKESHQQPFFIVDPLREKVVQCSSESNQAHGVHHHQLRSQCPVIESKVRGVSQHTIVVSSL